MYHKASRGQIVVDVGSTVPAKSALTVKKRRLYGLVLYRRTKIRYQKSLVAYRYMYIRVAIHLVDSDTRVICN